MGCHFHDEVTQTVTSISLALSCPLSLPVSRKRPLWQRNGDIFWPTASKELHPANGHVSLEWTLPHMRLWMTVAPASTLTTPVKHPEAAPRFLTYRNREIINAVVPSHWALLHSSR